MNKRDKAHWERQYRREIKALRLWLVGASLLGASLLFLLSELAR